MKLRLLIIYGILLMTTVFSEGCAQTKCIWMERSEDGDTVEKLGMSVHLATLLARPGANFDLDGVKLTYDSLVSVCKGGSEVLIKDNTGNGRTRIYGGSFHQKMSEQTAKHNYLIVESSDSGGAAKVSKIRVESLEAVGIVMAMIGSSNLDENIDRIQSALERGGILYIRDYKKNSRLWIYVN